MVSKHRWGNPIPTFALVKDLPVTPYQGQAVSLTPQGAVITLHLDDQDAIYGLGQQLGGINKRGRKYASYCTDDPHHTEEKTTLYGAHNFFVIKGDQPRGFYIDFSGRIDYDMASTLNSVITISIKGKDFDLYEFSGSSVTDLVTDFRSLIGKPYLPPLWAFGYFQSRWGYKSQEELLDLQNQFKKHQLPLEGIYVDIDYMDAFKDFTLNTTTYPDFKGLVKRFSDQNQYLVPIIDAGVKIEAGYDVYEEGIKDDHFVQDGSGKPYVAAVWPGRVHFPDFFRPETRQWFGDWYKHLIDMGIKGIWNDMNEPAIFYDEKKLEEAIDVAKSAAGKNLDIHTYFQLGDAFRNLSNNEDYYQTMVHRYQGKTYNNSDVHNLYGYFMTQSAFEGYEKHMPNERPLILSRASHVGMHRYGGIWTGDNASWWSHLATNVKQMPSLSMVGFLYSGADTGGFGAHAEAELLTRWLQFSVFTPLLRNHAAIGTRHQEPYQFGSKFTDYNRTLMSVRYRLVPWLYSEFLKAVETNTMLFKPLAFVYDTPRAQDIEDQILLGDGVMLAPVVNPNQKGRLVHLPEDMVLISLTDNTCTQEVMTKGDHYIDYDLSCLKFFVRPGHMVPIAEACKTTAQLNFDNLSWVKGSNQATYDFYKEVGHNKIPKISIEKISNKKEEA